MQIILILQVSHFVEQNGGTLEYMFSTCLLNARSCRKCGTGISLYKMDFCTLGFSGETKVLSRHITPLQKWTFVFLRACFVAGSHSAYVCACQVPHFLEASGSYNPKSAPKKAGWVP